jgi:hypothetical protein
MSSSPVRFPLREALQRVSVFVTRSARPSHRDLCAALLPLASDPNSVHRYAHLCVALLRWNGGWIHDGLAAALPAWEAADLLALPAVQILATQTAEGARITFANFDLERLVFAVHYPKRGKARAQVFEGATRVREAEAVAGLLDLGVPAFLARDKGRWRAVYGAARSRPFDRVERGILHGELPVYVVRDGTKRRVIVGAKDSASWERVTLPAWGGTMMEAAPEFFVEYEDGDAPVVYAGKGARGWTVVREGVAEKRGWEKLEDLTVLKGQVCYRGLRQRRWSVVEGDAASPAYDEVPKVTWVGGRAVYRARTGKTWTVVDGARYRHWYDEVSRGEMRGDDPFYAGRSGDTWWVHHGPHRWGPYRGVALLQQPVSDDLEATDEAALASVSYQVSLPDGSGEAVCRDGREVARFDVVVAALPTTAGVACAGQRGGKMVVIDVDGATLASVEGLRTLGESMGHAHFERLDGRTYFLSREGKKTRLHAGTWRSEPADEIVPLWLTSRGRPVYGAREQGQWWVRAGEAKRPLKKRPVAGLGPDTDGAEAGDTFSVMVTGNKTVDIAM